MKHICCVVLSLVLLASSQRSRSSTFTGYHDSLPEPVSNSTCYFYNFFTITCSYTLPPGYSDDIYAEVTYFQSDNKKLCYNGTNRQFEIDTPDKLNNLTYQIKLVDVRRKISRVSKLFHYNSDEATLPGKVTTLEVQDVTQSSMLVSWDVPYDWEKYSFRVTAISSWKEIIRNNTDSTSLLLEGLVPCTLYNISVQRRAYRYSGTTLVGHWSASQGIQQATKDTVPGAAPRLAPAVSGSTPEEITIYWQPLTRDCYSAEKGYVVSWENEQMQEKRVTVGVNRTSYSLTVPVTPSPVRVEVSAVSNEGSSLVSSLQVTPQEYEPSVPTFWVTGQSGNSAITYHWEPMTFKGDNCNVFWCRRNLEDTSCQSPLQWRSVLCEEGRLTVDTSVMNIYRLMLGISVESIRPGATVRSRIKWQQCVYSPRRYAPPPPKDFRLSPIQTPRSTRLEWRLPDCNNSPFISHYVISYCTVNVNTGFCAGSYWNVAVSNQATSHVVQDLESKTYKFFISSVSQDLEGPDSSSVIHHVEEGFSPVITLSVVGGMVAVLTVAIALLVCKYRKRKFCKWREDIDTPHMYTEPRDPPLPPRPEKMAVNLDLPRGLVGEMPQHSAASERGSQTEICENCVSWSIPKQRDTDYTIVGLAEERSTQHRGYTDINVHEDQPDDSPGPVNSEAFSYYKGSCETSTTDLPPSTLLLHSSCRSETQTPTSEFSSAIPLLHSVNRSETQNPTSGLSSAIPFLRFDDRSETQTPVVGLTSVIPLLYSDDRSETQTPVVGLTSVIPLLYSDDRSETQTPVVGLTSVIPLLYSDDRSETQTTANGLFSVIPLLDSTDRSETQNPAIGLSSVIPLLDSEKRSKTQNSASELLSATHLLHSDDRSKNVNSVKPVLHSGRSSDMVSHTDDSLGSETSELYSPPAVSGYVPNNSLF